MELSGSNRSSRYIIGSNWYGANDLPAAVGG